MRTLLVILGVIALLLVLGGAVNHGTEVSLDYVAGSADAVSLFWVALVAAGALLFAGAAGWAVGRGGDAGARRKLEKELEGTYRRLRDCEAKLPRPPEAPAAETATLVAAPVEAATEVAPALAEEATVVANAPVGEATEVAPTPADDVTAVASEPVEDVTVVASTPAEDEAPASADANGDAGRALSEPADDAPAGDDPTAGDDPAAS